MHFSIKIVFANIFGTMARSGTRITVLYFMSKTLSESYAKIPDRSVLTSSVTPGKVIKIFLLTRDRMEIETRKWCKTIKLVNSVRMVCILTYLGHDLNWT